MKKVKQIIIIAMVLLLCFGTMPVQAAGKNVTASMKRDRDLNALVRDVNAYTTCELFSNHPKRWKKERVNGYNALSIAGFVGFCHGKAFFSKKEIHKITYDLFGKKPNVKSIPDYSNPRRKFLAKNERNPLDGAYIYGGGDWGDDIPKYKIKKITRIRKGI